MARASRAEWAKRVERWQQSGLTAKEFAAQTGLKQSTLSYWKWALRSTPSEPPRRASKKRASRAPAMTKSASKSGPRQGPAAEQLGSNSGAFVEVTAGVAVSGSLELVLGGHLTVRVPVGFDEETLTRLMRAVEGSQ